MGEAPWPGDKGAGVIVTGAEGQKNVNVGRRHMNGLGVRSVGLVRDASPTG